VLATNKGSEVFDNMLCLWQRTKTPTACKAMFEQLKRIEPFEGREVTEYDFDYLHVLPAAHLVTRRPQVYETGFPFGANRRFALNIQAEYRGLVFGCLVNGLMGGSRVLAHGMKVGGLHATNTQISSGDYKQTDNVLIYTNSLLEDEVMEQIEKCKQDHADPEGVPMLMRVEEGVFAGDDDGSSYGNQRCEGVGDAVGKMTDYRLLDIFNSEKRVPLSVTRATDTRNLFYPLFEMFVLDEFVSNTIQRCSPSKLHT